MIFACVQPTNKITKEVHALFDTDEAVLNKLQWGEDEEHVKQQVGNAAD